MKHELKYKVDIEALWLKYIKLSAMEKIPKESIQYKETRKAFYGGVGMGLVASKEMPASLTDEEGAYVLDDMAKQVAEFYQIECDDWNKGNRK